MRQRIPAITFGSVEEAEVEVVVVVVAAEMGLSCQRATKVKSAAMASERISL